MSSAADSRANVGFQVWNMAKRLSCVTSSARHAEDYLAERLTANDWSEGDLSLLGEITVAFQECSQQADETHERLLAVVSQSDPTLIDTDDDGFSVIHNHGLDPDLMAKVDAVWHADTSVSRSRVLESQFEELVARVEGSERETHHE